MSVSMNISNNSKGNRITQRNHVFKKSAESRKRHRIQATKVKDN